MKGISPGRDGTERGRKEQHFKQRKGNKSAQDMLRLLEHRTTLEEDYR